MSSKSVWPLSRLIIRNNMANKLHQGTLCVQAGYQAKNGEPRQMPIYQSTTFKYDSSEEMTKLFDLESN